MGGSHRQQRRGRRVGVARYCSRPTAFAKSDVVEDHVVQAGESPLELRETVRERLENVKRCIRKGSQRWDRELTRIRPYVEDGAKAELLDPSVAQAQIQRSVVSA